MSFRQILNQGGGGGGGSTFTTQTNYNATITNDFTIPEAGRWRFSVVKTAPGNNRALYVCTSGLANISGGFYSINNSGDLDNGNFRQTHAEWDSVNNRFRMLFVNGSSSVSSSNLLNSQWTSGTPTANQNVAGVAAFRTSGEFIANTDGLYTVGARWWGEMVTTGAVTFRPLTANSNTFVYLVNTNNVCSITLNKIT